MKPLFKTLLTVVLLLQVGVVHALPAGVHFTFCFGPDGHFDLSQEFCAASAAAPCTRPASLADHEDHHDDCLDLATGCGTFRHFLRAGDIVRQLHDGNGPIARFPAARSFLPVFLLFPDLSSPAPATIDGGSPPSPPPLDALRTTILLI